jgi:3-oxoacyl-[acyl-carrier-protein] synthase II
MTDAAIVIAGAGVIADYELVLPGIAQERILRGVSDDALKKHISRRGIRYKDKSTRLALAAAKQAMADAALCRDGYADLDDQRCAVLVASCFGNVDTVLRCAAHIAREGAHTLSPMDLPNASTNVIASTLAIWFGLRGPNMLLANGPGSGLEILSFACILLGTGRVDRALVCGVEAAQPLLASLFSADASESALPIDIAAAVVLETASAHAARGGPDTAVRVNAHLNAATVSCQLSLVSGGKPLSALASPLVGSPLYAQAHGAAGVLATIATLDHLLAHTPSSDLVNCGVLK